MKNDIMWHTKNPYRAPEQLDLHSGYPVGSRVDIFLLGIFLFTMMYFKMPFTEDKHTDHVNGIFQIPSEPDYSQKMISLLKNLMQKNPVKRPSIDEVFSILETI